MQESIPQGYLPESEVQSDELYPLPELHYPEQTNVVTELVDRHVREGRGDDVAIYFREAEITYAQLKDRVDRFGNALKARGVEPGDRVLVRFPNRPEAVVAILATQKIGAVAVPSMKLLRAKELTYVIENAEVSVAVVYEELLDELEAAIEEVGLVEDVVVAGESGETRGHQSYDELLSSASEDLSAHPTSVDDLALMLYTSGTTGQPKGAVHTHRQVLSTADSYANYCLDPSREDVFGGNAPLPFAYGYGCYLTFPFRFGASTSLTPDADPGDLLEAVESHGITVLCSIPTAFNQILTEYPDAAETYDLSSLRLCTSAGEPLTEETYRAFDAEFGIDILDGIGSTEMLHIFISHRLGDDIDPTATGYPVPGYEAKVVDPDTYEELERGDPGLLLVRGPTGITYWKKPDKQESAVQDGWSIPGDIYVHREDGRFEYKSRQDDLIISSGYNIPGPEVEAVLEERDEVLTSAVVGSPDEERGEVVKAFVVTDGAVDPDDALAESLQTHVKDTLAPYKYPREIEFLAELPRTETGKIQRAKLREREHEQQPATT
jgi:2-aminobenzoate-CoA ligase